MFDVLVFVYENYWRGDACPRREQLERKLSAVGFEAQEIQDALTWLGGLSVATQQARAPAGSCTKNAASAKGHADAGTAPVFDASPGSMRVYAVAEQNRLGAQCLGFVRFLENAGVLPPPMREIVIDRCMASTSETLSLEDLKIIVLMVYWSLGEEPDALVLDELCDDARDRLAH